eukprot:3875633-Alexandrium_andersonii.AAC.1
MSASLVGSEMCIRDRNRLVGEVRMKSIEANQILSRNSMGAHQRLQRAVSYTHLTLPTICSV